MGERLVCCMIRYCFILGLFLCETLVAVVPVAQIRTLLHQNRLDEGISGCKQIEMLSELNKEAAFACAWIYARKEQVSATEGILEKFRKFSHLPEYQMITAYTYIIKKQYERAEKILISLEKENKGTPVGHQTEQLRAEFYEAKGQAETAAFIYRGLGTEGKYTDNARIAWGLGRYYLSKGDTRRAIQFLEQAARAWPKHVGSRFNLALIYISLGDETSMAKAGGYLAEGYHIDNNDVGVLEQLGILFEKKGQLNEAISKWQRAIAVKKDAPIANEKLNLYFNNVVDALMDKGNYREALKKLEGAPKGLQEELKYVLRRGVIYRHLAKTEKAISDFQSYLAKNPKDGMALRELGICYLNLNLKDKAWEYFSKAVVEEPENGINHSWIAFVLETKQEYVRAEGAWSKAVELLKDPKELDKASRRLASVRKRLKKQQKKEEEAQKEE